jgi:carboxymethylenebutenolidase
MTSKAQAEMGRLTASDGHTLDCWMQPALAPRQGGVVLLQEIFGVTDQLKGVAERYARLGYDVAIPALFDRAERNAVMPFDQPAKGRDLMLAADIDATLRDISAAVAALTSQGGKVAVIGFCWGGGLALRAAQVLGIAGAVAFYGTRLNQYLDRPLKAPVLGHFGTKDDHTPPEMLAQLQDYLPEVEMHMYEAGHAFANDARPSFLPDEAALAHQRTESFLARVMQA